MVHSHRQDACATVPQTLSCTPSGKTACNRARVNAMLKLIGKICMWLLWGLVGLFLLRVV